MCVCMNVRAREHVTCTYMCMCVYVCVGMLGEAVTTYSVYFFRFGKGRSPHVLPSSPPHRSLLKDLAHQFPTIPTPILSAPLSHLAQRDSSLNPFVTVLSQLLLCVCAHTLEGWVSFAPGRLPHWAQIRPLQPPLPVLPPCASVTSSANGYKNFPSHCCRY